MASRPNRLANETSPYLLQHAHNPVDWYPWSDEVFTRARAEGKPIFLSVGYSACHWCHVMERESFENEQTADLLNQYFLSVKVDREERPDIDQIYMAAVQAMTGHGGWPMSVFLTPEGKPFYGGTYFPPADRPGMPGFPRVLQSVAQAWENRQEEIRAAADGMTDQLQSLGQLRTAPGTLDESLLDNAFSKLSRAFDPQHGGFGDAPKFPHPMDLRVLLRHHHRTGDPHALHMVRLTLDKMAQGGIYDHLGGGFARYSTDDRWLVPHFEKMLYDNALLVSTYVEAYQSTREARYVSGRHAKPSTTSSTASPPPTAGSTPPKTPTARASRASTTSGPSTRSARSSARRRPKPSRRSTTLPTSGNWEHANILNLPHPIAEAASALKRDEEDLRNELKESRSRLLEARVQRIPPGKDTKILTSWNGLMIAAMADAGRALNNPRYLESAARAAEFLLDHHRTEDGRLLHASKDGRARFPGYLEDYAYLIDGLTRLFEATGEPLWITSALDLSDLMLADFLDDANGGFYFTAKNHETLIVRPKEPTDNATPSGNAMAATALLRLAALTGRSDLEDHARRALESVRALLEQAPTAAGQSLIALDFLLAPTREFAVIGADDHQEFEAVMSQISLLFLPHKVVAPSPGPVSADLAEIVPLLASRPTVDNRTTTYICERFACQAPVVGVEGITEALDAPS